MGKTTDILMTTGKNTSIGKLEKKDLDDILSMGERTSIRIFSAALRSNDADSCYFDPIDQNRPVITDDAFQNANPIAVECEKKIKDCIVPIVEKGTIPVIPGFIGKTKDGKITTLGRGGSDTPAFVLAQALNADQIILVTDADGYYVSYPKNNATPKTPRKLG
jgi:aspartate kinase